MEPIFGFALFGIFSIIVALIAKSRGRSALLFFITQVILGFVFVVLANMSGATGLQTGWAGFAAPALALLFAFGMKSADEIASEQGSFRGLKKCPQCAESIKAEALKCKHCGSQITSQN